MAFKFKITQKQRVMGTIALSTAFFICEITFAILTHSLALQADAFHYLSDILGYVVTLTAIIISERTEAPQELSFGWQRAKLLGAFFNGSFLLALGISVLIQSFERFTERTEIKDPDHILIIGCVGLGLNLISVFLLHEHNDCGHGHDHDHDSHELDGPHNHDKSHSHAHNHNLEHSHGHTNHLRYQRGSSSGSSTDVNGTGSGTDESAKICAVDIEANAPAMYMHPTASTDSHSEHRHIVHRVKAPLKDLNMMAAKLHVVCDLFGNIGVIVAAAIIWKTDGEHRNLVDPAVSVVIALLILFAAVPLLKKSGNILLQSAPEGVNLVDIKHDIEKIPGISSVHELHVWRLDQKKAIASAHVLVSDPDMAKFVQKAKIISECLHAYGIHSITLQPELVTAPSTPTGCQMICASGMCEKLTCCSVVIEQA
ncbi:cation efflux protein [Podospora australis]|uniref:Cation efflux protein n=1 Tax=Podospora australis TaxID=1536484 RepID=A0AAN6X525_9PEZI|nr:cation efflux protein [Podospora australis]